MNKEKKKHTWAHPYYHLPPALLLALIGLHYPALACIDLCCGDGDGDVMIMGLITV